MARRRHHANCRAGGGVHEDVDRPGGAGPTVTPDQPAQRRGASTSAGRRSHDRHVARSGQVSRNRHGDVFLLALFLLALLLGSGCGRDAADVGASPEARGAELAKVHGCTSCHGAEGEGGFGPPWQGLAGAEVELVDGTRVRADDDYLRRSILEPSAHRRKGYALPMPAVPLTAGEVDDLVAHIHTFD